MEMEKDQEKKGNSKNESCTITFSTHNVLHGQQRKDPEK